jgi:hypothetical protein
MANLFLLPTAFHVSAKDRLLKSYLQVPRQFPGGPRDTTSRKQGNAKKKLSTTLAYKKETDLTWLRHKERIYFKSSMGQAWLTSIILATQETEMRRTMV